MKLFRKLTIGAALVGFLFTGALAGTGYSQARASLTNGMTVTIRSIISGTFPFGNGNVSGSPTFTGTPIFTANGVASGNTYKAGGVLYYEFVNQTTTSTSAVPKFSTAFAIKGGTLGTAGDRLKVHVSVSFSTATTDNKNLQCNIGYSSFNTSTGAFTGGLSIIAESSVSNAGSLSWWVDSIVARYSGATNTSYEWQSKWGSSATTQGANFLTDTGGINWASDNNFLCAVYNTSPGTQTLTLNEVNLEWIPYRP